MRIAWLRPDSATAADSLDDPLDDIAALINTLRSSHDIELVSQQQAHDFVWRQARTPSDLVIHELADTPAHRFVVPYALHFPGALLLRAAAPQYTRALAAARWTIVGDPASAAALREQHPDADVVDLPVGLDAPRHERAGGRGTSAPLKLALLTEQRRAAAERAIARTRESGSRVELLPPGPPAERLAQADVALALEWPPPVGPPASAIAGMAAGLPVVVFETLVTAGWPALDPQTWQPRGFLRDERPIVISIDPRDEEHSLMLAARRLSADPLLRESLGAAASAWWQSHATAAHAATAWTAWLAGILSAPQPDRASQGHGDDGSEHARSVLTEFGVQVDFLTERSA